MRKPDLTAPRYLFKVYKSLNRDVIKRFLKRYPQYSTYSEKVLLNGLKTINKAIADQVLSTRDGVELPSNLGFLFAGLIDYEKPVLAMKQSVELGMKVYHRNLHTNGKLVRIIYSCSPSSMDISSGKRFENRQLWRFKAVRKVSRTIPKIAAENYNKWVSLDDKMHVWDLFKNNMYRDNQRKKTSKALTSYDEFDDYC